MTWIEQFSLAPLLLLGADAGGAPRCLWQSSTSICALHQLFSKHSKHLCFSPEIEFTLWHCSIKLLVKLNPCRICLGVRSLKQYKQSLGPLCFWPVTRKDWNMWAGLLHLPCRWAAQDVCPAQGRPGLFTTVTGVGRCLAALARNNWARLSHRSGRNCRSCHPLWHRWNKAPQTDCALIS